MIVVIHKNITDLKMMNDHSTDLTLLRQLKEYVYDIIGCCQRVHQGMGPFLNEYMYQDALEIELSEQEIPFVKEFSFLAHYHGKPIKHMHRVDFKLKEHVFLECKAVEKLGNEERQQLWNYMRLSNTIIGILYNFAPIKDQCEKYYLDNDTKRIIAF